MVLCNPVQRGDRVRHRAVAVAVQDSDADDVGVLGHAHTPASGGPGHVTAVSVAVADIPVVLDEIPAVLN